MKKTIISIFAVIAIIILGLFAYRIFQKPTLPQQINQPPFPISEQQQSQPLSSEKISKNSPFGMLPFFSYPMPSKTDPPSPDEFDFRYTKDLGLKWGRAHYLVWPAIQSRKEKTGIKNGVYDWFVSDAVLGSFPQGFNVVENILAFDPKRDDVGEHLDSFTFSSKEDEAAYIRFVEAGVERYDGDGKDDMPGLKTAVKYWQVDNEPDLKTDDWKGYANLLKITYETVKASCSDCKVLIGGMGGEMNGLRDFLAPAIKSLDGKYFDIFDYHCYGNKNDWKKCGTLAGEIKKAFSDDGGGFEIWLTETGTWSGAISYPPNQPFQSEKEQAGAVVKYYFYNLAKGVKKIFWAWGIVEGFGGPVNNIFDKTGLIYDGKYSEDLGYGVKKLSYYTYKKMVEVLEGSDWDNIQTVQERDGVYIYKFIRQGKPIWVAWNDNGSEKQITISGVNSSQVKIVEVVPKYETGKEVKDYNVTFNEYAKSPENGTISAILKDKPIFVEEI